jgi:hypothetical protein
MLNGLTSTATDPKKPIILVSSCKNLPKSPYFAKKSKNEAHIISSRAPQCVLAGRRGGAPSGAGGLEPPSCGRQTRKIHEGQGGHTKYTARPPQHTLFIPTLFCRKSSRRKFTTIPHQNQAGIWMGLGGRTTFFQNVTTLKPGRPGPGPRSRSRNYRQQFHGNAGIVHKQIRPDGRSILWCPTPHHPRTTW